MQGFTMFKDTYAAIPYGKHYLIIHNGQQLDKLCKTEASARKYIQDHKRSKSLAELPVD